MYLSDILFLLTLPFLSHAVASPSPSYLPVLIWHGLGDSSTSPSLSRIAKLINTTHPSTQVHIISLAPPSASPSSVGQIDQRASFVGNLTLQISSICTFLSTPSTNPFNPPLYTFNAVGFSQGGLFLRGLIQTCPAIQIKSLLTFGSPHNGISSLPACSTFDVLCKTITAAFRKERWSSFVQGNIVPAQYYREVNGQTGEAGDDYLDYSGWLANINRERNEDRKSGRGREYIDRLSGIDKLVMYMFEKDKTIVPRETAWFADKNETTGLVRKLTDRALYKEDWIGLKKLDEKNGLVFNLIEGKEHMDISDDLLVDAVREYFHPIKEDKHVNNEESRWDELRTQHIFT